MMSDGDTNLLKLDMQIIAKRLKLKGKTSNILQYDSSLAKKNKKQKNSDVYITNSKQSSNENNQKKVFSRKKKNIFQRPVDYTWNRGGRLKEIRIRTQARKYLYLWIQKTFGRFTFSTASKFYNKKMLHKSFCLLKANWWENCGEMKILIRADYFYKYHIYAKVWIAWTEFTISSKQQKALHALASKNYTISLYKRSIKNWKTYIQLKKMKKALYNKGYAIAKHNMMRETWNVWIISLKCKHRLLHNCQVAISYWENFTLKKIWNFWKYRSIETLHTKQQIILAQKKQNLSLTKRYFSCWQNYIAFCYKKHILYEKARKLYNLSLKHRMLCLWWARYEKLLLLQKQMRSCHVLGSKLTKRRFFLAWLEYVERKHFKRRQQAIAFISHRRLLMRKGMEGFRFLIFLNKRKVVLLLSAQTFYKNYLLRKSWVVWQKKMEVLEEQEMSEISSVAREHYRWKLIKSSFYVFLNYKNWRKSRKQKMIKAEAHFVVKALPRYFALWRRFVDEIKDINEMKRDAKQFHREVLLTKFFYTWSSAFEQVKEDRIRERLAVMQHTENCLRHHYSLWLRKTRLILSTNHNDAVARVQYRRSLLKNAIKGWLSYTKYNLHKEKKRDNAVTHHRFKLRANAWMTWRKYVARCREKSRKYALAASHHVTHVVRKCVKSWKNHVTKAKEISSKAERRLAKKRQTLLVTFFQEWQRFTALSRLKNTGKAKADTFRDKRLLSLALVRWRSWTALRHFKSAQKEEQLTEARERLHRTKLRVTFGSWSQATNIAVSERSQLERARSHYRHRVCKVVLQAWQLHKYIILKKNLMQRQARMFQNASLVHDVMSRWKTSLLDKRDQASKTVDALWHWAASLQGRCFDNWRSYVKERVRKKRRYNHAMDARRSFMVREGCVRILKHHSDALAYRTRFEACQQAEARYTGYHLAWKYGKQWIGKVRVKMKEKKINFSLSDDRLLFPPSDLSDFERNIPSLSKLLSIKPLPITKERLCSHESSFAKRCSPPKQRPAPRLPNFLNESLEREGLFADHVKETASLHPINRFHQALASDASLDVKARGEPIDWGPLSKKTPLLPSSITSLTTSRASIKPENTLPVSPHDHPTSSIGESTSLVLLPPSAFHSPSPPAPPTSCWTINSSETERKSASGSDSDTASTDTLTDSKETFKTFVASPGHDREELKLIYEKLQRFQKMREQLKILKQQKSVLERWIDENLSTMSSSKSLDFMSVQEEIGEIDCECSRISRELLEKRPEVENLAVRVRVLCARPK